MTPKDLRNIHTTGNSCRDEHGTKTTPVFLPAAEEASWLLHPSSVSLLLLLNQSKPIVTNPN